MHTPTAWTSCPLCGTWGLRVRVTEMGVEIADRDPGSCTHDERDWSREEVEAVREDVVEREAYAGADR